MTFSLVVRPAAVVFDMDGLMLDTEFLALRAWQEAAGSLGVAFDPALGRKLIGRNWLDCQGIVRAHCPAGYPADALLDRWHATYDAVVARDGIAKKPGIVELLDWLASEGTPCAVATSTRRDRARSKLADAGLLPRFAALVGGDEIARGKPAPDIYVEAARRLATPPARCVALEDSEPGIRAAMAAGLHPIMVPDLLPPSPELVAAGPLVVASLHEARARLAALPCENPANARRPP